MHGRSLLFALGVCILQTTLLPVQKRREFSGASSLSSYHIPFWNQPGCLKLGTSAFLRMGMNSYMGGITDRRLQSGRCHGRPA
jgi:hypothetical protein